jgi:acetyl-CoA C-acetyltransferase
MSRSAHAALIKPEMKLGSVEFADTMITDGLYCSLTDEGMGELSERANPSFGISRKVQDEIAYQSHQRAAEAVQRGRLAKEIVETGSLVQDEGIRKSATREGVAALQPAFAQDGTITAGNASQMSDGASVGVVISAAEAERIGVSPLARIVSFAEVAGPDNTLHLKPATAIRAVCERAQVKVSDVDLFEINEAFAAVVAASVDDLGLSMETVNPNGGAISLGHPLGGTGMRLLITLAHELSHRDLTYGIAALCGGGGQGLAVLIERSAR